jgi:DNA-binding NtrC family response regulator
MAAIAAYSWPGNIRELENRVKRAIVMADGKVISATDLDLKPVSISTTDLNLRSEVEKLEATLVQKALDVANGNISKAAKLLGVSRPHLYSLMKGQPPE